MRVEEDLSSGAGSSEPLPYAGPVSHGGNGRAQHARPAERGSVRPPTRVPRSIHDDPTLSHAVSHSLAAAKSTVADRLALMRLEAQQALGRLAGGGVLLAAGALVLVNAWFAVMVGAVLAMGVWWGATLSLPIRLLIATGATAALGGGLLAGGLSSMRRPAEASGRNEHDRATAHTARSL